MAVEDNFKKLLELENNFEMNKKIAEAFQDRQMQREKLYAQQEQYNENFDFYREYVI